MRKMLLAIPLLMSVIMLASSPSELYRHAARIEQDSLSEAVRLYRQAADSGYAPAKNYLGFLHYQGRGVSHSLDSALLLIDEAASVGYPLAYNNLGWLLLYGDGIKHDRAKAEYWLGRAADAGHAPSAVQLAELLLQNNVVDSTRVRDLARKAGRGGLLRGGEILWRLDSARYDGMSADSMLVYAKRYYYDGAPTPALKLLQRMPDNADAVYLLADATSRGYGVPYNYRKALQLYQRAAEMGNETARDIINETLEMFPDALPTDSVPCP